QASFDATNQFLNLLLDPFNNGHLGGGTEDGATGFAQEGEPLGYAGTKSNEASEAYAAVTPRDKARSLRADPFAARWGVWAAGYGGSSKVTGDAVTGSHDTTSNIYGTAVGADYRASPDTLLG